MDLDCRRAHRLDHRDRQGQREPAEVFAALGIKLSVQEKELNGLDLVKPSKVHSNDGTMLQCTGNGAAAASVSSDPLMPE